MIVFGLVDSDLFGANRAGAFIILGGIAGALPFLTVIGGWPFWRLRLGVRI